MELSLLVSLGAKMTNIDFSCRVTVPELVIVKRLDDEMVILDLGSESYFGLNDVGTAMWHELEISPSIQQAYLSLLEQYDIHAETLRKDLTNLIRELVDRNLLIVESA